MVEFISIPLKRPSDIDIVKPLQNAIKSTFSVTHSKDYSEAIAEFSKLRKNALWRAFEKYESSLEAIYRYYDQICVMENKIPCTEIQIPFKWKDAFDRTIFGGKLSLTVCTLAYEKVCVLFNIAALQSSIAATQSLENDDGLKLSAKLFQQAAGIFNHLKGNIMSAVQQEPTPDMSPETLEALSMLMLAQAQEIFMFKAIHDNMKDLIVAKLAAQTEEFYSETLKLFQKEIFRAFWDKDWIPLITGKQLGYRGLAEYYQSMVCKSCKKVGEEITRLEYAVEMFKQAQIKSNRLTFYQDYSSRAMKNLTEAKKDNDFIYHERVPDIQSLPAIDRATIAKLLPLPGKFSSNFEDLFEELLPISVHHAMSNFEGQKIEIVNAEITKLRNSRQTLNKLLVSLNLPAAIEDFNGNEVPQSLIAKAEFIRASGGIKVLETTMNDLPELLQRNKDILDEAERMLSEEQDSDDHLRAQFQNRWTRTPSQKLTEHFRINTQKYRGIINNAIAADRVVREKFETHRDAVNLLSMEPADLANSIPTGSAIQENRTVKELRALMEEVETLKAEQDVIESELKSVGVNMQEVFLSALVKDGHINESNLISENIATHYGPLQNQVRDSIQRQEELMQAIQAKHAEFANEQSSCGSNREQTLCRLAAAYDAFKEIRNNLNEGVKFYNDLTQVLILFQNKISDFCFARKTEKEELLKDLTKNLSTDNSGSNVNIPKHHADFSPQGVVNPQVPSNLPYPIGEHRFMPVPYQVAPVTPYPNYMHAPMPTTFNPYATMHGGYVQPTVYQMPPGSYGYHHDNSHAPDGSK